MRTFIWSFSVFFCVILSSFSQVKNIEKATYLSTNKGQKIKLNLLDNNKYELVFYSGDYEIKGDSLLFSQKIKSENTFDVAFTTDKKAKKIKIKFLDPSYYSFYVGTQNSNNPVQYQKITDIRTKVDPEWTQTNLEFEVDKADYLYLVYEDYNGESKLTKFALPKDVSEVVVNYQLAALDDLNIAGFFDKKTNELKISEQKGKNPLVFLNEKDTPQASASKVIPLESQTISNWTYPGKQPLISDDFGSKGEVVDSAAVAVDAYAPPAPPKSDFKLRIENNLKNAVASTKNKLLVVYVDSKNPSAKADFDTFIKEQEAQLGYTMYDGYHAEYDLFNYYLASEQDKKWLKTNKITDNPGLIVLNENGEILATSKSKLAEKQAQFNYYDGFYKKAQRVNILLSFDKAVKNKKATDADLIMAFNKAAVLEMPYDYDYTETSEENPEDFKLVKVTLDKKTVSQTWKKLIEAHQKDTKPNMYLVETILKEIKNQGFYKQFFNEDKVLTDTDFLAIDYLIKHADAIETERVVFNEKEGEKHLVGNVVAEITSALQQNTYIEADGVSGEANKDKTISVYKKIIGSGKGNFECYRNYFAYLSEVEDKDGSNTSYLKEFSSYFNANLATDKGSAIERLDEMYATLDPISDYSYNGWNAFKEYHSNLCNSAAWTVVLKPGNADFLKSAIGWSEYSLAVTKNNPYYLDTLAQLYYKDGQKQKAVETQRLAVKYLNAEVEAETAVEIRETLTKMQDGTY
ncbi:hypothetical protein SAMN05444397_106138 [Flavobacterium aquidurense]|uniref:Uncharacterized protein n=1 Tax=Flavobacterium frigidimaris TaxID=262320 RepID=A0ABX4BRS2_FLAFR|nr:hypothetical protein [Flavobacterium frigidimaris]OXA79915.1 hypothetical protein B0A65_08180 [Flavobacterium frigidimaris]SDZ40155.1 hypothetical protein SAMN05444397_106138 [Flavobacterium aquidurense]